MSIAQQIRKRRLAMNLSEAEVAASAGLSVSGYGDIEAYDDEWKDVPLGQLKSICDSLQLDVCSLVDPAPTSGSASAVVSRAAAIAQALQTTGKSVATLSDEIGVVEPAIHQLLSDAAVVETWPTEFVLALCSSLKIPFRTVCHG
jgi:transcriptional regulator with XRE-family HTH domain